LKLTTLQKHGLDEVELKIVEDYLKEPGEKEEIPEEESQSLYMQYMSGYSLPQLFLKFPKEEKGRIIYTAVKKNWIKQRELLNLSIMDRIKSNLIMSVQDSSETIATLISYANEEVIGQIRRYKEDPTKNPKPNFSMNSISDFQKPMQMLESLIKSVTNFTIAMKDQQDQDAARKERIKQGLENGENRKESPNKIKKINTTEEEKNSSILAELAN
jgi:hypothetical protein